MKNLNLRFPNIHDHQNLASFDIGYGEDPICPHATPYKQAAAAILY